MPREVRMPNQLSHNRAMLSSIPRQFQHHKFTAFSLQGINERAAVSRKRRSVDEDGRLLMAEEQTYLLDACALAQEMLGHVDEAAGTSDPEAAREHIEQALDVAQDFQEELDGTLSASEEPEMSDQLEEALHHLDMATELGETALDAPDEEIEDHLSSMLRHAQQSYAFLQGAMGVCET